MPFFSPLWARGPRVVFLHHVHAEMWEMVLPPKLARLGRLVEQRMAPPFYRRTRIVTLSPSSRSEIVSMLRMDPARVSVVEPGVDDRFIGATSDLKSERPLVVAVGRLVPVKRFELLMDALAKVKVEHPELRAVIVGEGYERPNLEARRHELERGFLDEMPGKLSDEELRDVYASAWVLTSSSLREGWGMTITEAGACGTPAVATRIAGHTDAIDGGQKRHPRGRPGCDRRSRIGPDRIPGDFWLASREGARANSARFSWDRTASGTLRVLVDEARRRRGLPTRP